ncbi:3-deoxy-manno-octulosonate cytidylyltransferase [Bacillus zanthoxyli]|nr:3-deoxy-manno-octulosonate cytidylyltransferase [Bacillus zanthoxyli]
MEVIGIIPARYGSTRLPGKPLAKILGKPMIQHVVEKAMEAKLLNEVIVATDQKEILEEVKAFGGNAILTSKEHESGSDRIEEVASKIKGDLFVNIQGDEPLINPHLIDSLIETAKKNMDSVVTAKTKIAYEDAKNPNTVKVIVNSNDEALYFSRSLIPYNRGETKVIYYKHIGIYCYPKSILHEYVQLPKSKLEQTELLEQLRLLENGYKIKVIETLYNPIGVDTIEDLEKVEKLMEGNYVK